MPATPGALLAVGERSEGVWGGPGLALALVRVCSRRCCRPGIRFPTKDWEALGRLLASLPSCPETFCSSRKKTQHEEGINAKQLLWEAETLQECINQ